MLEYVSLDNSYVIAKLPAKIVLRASISNEVLEDSV